MSCNATPARAAKYLDSVTNRLIQGEHRKTWNIVISYDEVSQLYCCKLMPLFGIFERRIRELVYITIIKIFGVEWYDNSFLNSAKEDMLNKKKDFDEIYSDLMQRADGQCYSAYIGEDYLPHINMGQYRERSASVPKRLMYFLTLLIESLKNDINFPRFLMIDTPNKEGIDKDNLIKNIALLTEADKYNYENKCPFQIILTTGIDTYPEDYKKFVFFKLEGEKYLLQENILEEK